MTEPVRFVNLLPGEFLTQFALRTRRRLWFAGWLMTVIVCGGIIAVRQMSVRSLELEATMLRSRAAPLERLMRETERLSRGIGADSAHPFAALIDSRPPVVQVIGAVAMAAETVDGRLWLDEVQLLPSAARATSADGKSAKAALSPASQEFQIVGHGADNLAISKLVEQLRSGGAFSHVQLASTVPSEGSAKRPGAQRQFVVHCRVGGSP